jgi:hypothetical protein
MTRPKGLYTGRTSISDLYSLLNKMNIKNAIVISKDKLKNTLKNKNIKNIIINLDSKGMGTHWVALNTDKKLYFDSYAERAVLAVPKDYKLASKDKQLQSLTSSDCGGLCCLFLYYINFKNLKEFYKDFKDVY